MTRPHDLPPDAFVVSFAHDAIKNRVVGKVATRHREPAKICFVDAVALPTERGPWWVRKVRDTRPEQQKLGAWIVSPIRPVTFSWVPCGREYFGVRDVMPRCDDGDDIASLICWPDAPPLGSAAMDMRTIARRLKAMDAVWNAPVTGRNDMRRFFDSFGSPIFALPAPSDPYVIGLGYVFESPAGMAICEKRIPSVDLIKFGGYVARYTDIEVTDRAAYVIGDLPEIPGSKVRRLVGVLVDRAGSAGSANMCWRKVASPALVLPAELSERLPVWTEDRTDLDDPGEAARTDMAAVMVSDAVVAVIAQICRMTDETATVKATPDELAEPWNQLRRLIRSGRRTESPDAGTDVPNRWRRRYDSAYRVATAIELERIERLVGDSDVVTGGSEVTVMDFFTRPAVESKPGAPDYGMRLYGKLASRSGKDG